MIIFPAIDLLGGKCVRLRRGEYGSAEQVAEDPIGTAEHFAEAGTEYLHTVDLDGAKNGEGRDENRRAVAVICRRGLFPVELGGGIRTLDDIDAVLSLGVSRAILGSAATNLEFLEKAVNRFGDRIAVGIDAKNGLVATSGWMNTTTISYLEFAKNVVSLGVGTIIFTDVGRDGMLSGPNLGMLDELKNTVPTCNITASGGVKTIDDIKALTERNLYGAICGKSIYAGTLDLGEAIAFSRR